MSIPVLIITGTVGVGKTTVAFAMHELLCELERSHAMLDMDDLVRSYPPRGYFNRDAGLDALAAMWPTYGSDRLIMVDVIEERSQIRRYEEAIPCADIAVCRLIASEKVRMRRIASRDEGASREWHLHRTVELDAILDAAEVENFVVDNGTRPALEVAREVLTRAGWI